MLLVVFQEASTVQRTELFDPVSAPGIIIALAAASVAIVSCRKALGSIGVLGHRP